MPTLRDLRIKNNLSLAEMAEIIGKGKSSLSNYELGKGRVPDGVYETLSKRFNISVENLKAGTWGEDQPQENALESVAPEKESDLQDFMNEPVEGKPAEPKKVSRRATAKKEPANKVPARNETAQKTTAKRTRAKAKTKEEEKEKGELPVTQKPKRGGRPSKGTLAPQEEKVKKPVLQEAEKVAVQEKPSIPVYIQSLMGGSINTADLIAKVDAVAPYAEIIYVKPEENRAYWTGAGRSGYVVLW